MSLGLALALYGLNFLFGDINRTSENHIDAGTLESDAPVQKAIKEKLLVLS